MTRNVVLMRLPEDATVEARLQLEEGLAGIAALSLPGQRAVGGRATQASTPRSFRRVSPP
jgi:hypothetical protein